MGLNGDWVPVLAQDLGAVSYEDKQTFAKTTLDSYVVAAEWVSDTQVLIVEQSDLFVGTDVTSIGPSAPRPTTQPRKRPSLMKPKR